MEQENRAFLEDQLKQYGISLPDGAVARIERHLALVVEWNERVNLTAITDERSMIIKHVLDSLLLLRWIRPADGSALLDVGTGAGYPGVPLRAALPRTEITLLDSLAKRCKFLELVGQELFGDSAGVTAGFRVVWGRAEEAGQKPELRGRFGLVVARAVAPLPVLAEYCLPFCRLGGMFVAMKGPDAAQELEGASLGIRVLGGEVVERHQLELPEAAGGRSFILIRKVRETPRAYPRRPGIPAKSPL